VAGLLQDWRGAHDRAAAYCRALGAPDALREELAHAAVEDAHGAEHWRGGRGAVAATVDALVRRILAGWTGEAAADAPVGEAFLRWRLGAFRAGGLRGAGGAPAGDAALHAGPELARAPMAPERYAGRRLGEWRRPSRAAAAPPLPRAPAPRWRRRARLRRTLLFALVLLPSAVAGGFMLQLLPAQGRGTLEPLIAGLFGALFGWISIGFWTAVAGFALLLRGGDRFALGRAEGAGPIDPQARTAIVMPVCNEPVDRVFAGLRAIRASLARVGAEDPFDFFVLSDSTDPDVIVAEEEAWAAWLRELGGKGGLFYRRRKVRRKRKSGNVADFCRRWGRLYRYMVVLDADSLMEGETLVELVRRMERHPDVGVIQTVPTVVRAQSLFGRVQQFSSRLYGPMFAAGMHYWQLGDGPYWGHNAILRVAPFMAHCGLPRLSGTPPFGGDVMSHDFVEAALLGRAGWSVWLAFDLGGTYEEAPEALIEEMDRDRRWCQGNLQHLRLLFTEGIRTSHRTLFLNGIFAYVSALLWLAFLAASTAEVVLRTLRPPDYFPSGPSLFPEWPVWRPDWALALLGVTAVFLFLPKALGLVLALVQRRRGEPYPGLGRLLRGAALELLVSSLLAPVRMLFYCRFVLANLVGRAVGWRAGESEGGETSWAEALRRHGPDTAVALAWAALIHALDPERFWWLSPVVAGLALAVAVSVVASRKRVGLAARAGGWLVVPEESDPPEVLRDVERELARARDARTGAGPRDGLRRAVVDPWTNAVHVALQRGPRRVAAAVRARREALRERVLRDGPGALSPQEERLLLADRDGMAALHLDVWRLDDARCAARWLRPARAAD
jgi:membrane glycosyltransferase